MNLILGLTFAAANAFAWTQAELRDFQGDLMIWAPEVGCSPEANIRCNARGLQKGWVWSLSIPRYSKENRQKLYDAIVRQGYTHVAIDVPKCEVGNGYHDLYPTSAAYCAGNAARLNAVLKEIQDRKLIAVCADVAPGVEVEPGLDKSLCPIAMTDWDNSNEADCRIKAVAQAFPNALVYYELPGGDVKPKPDECSPTPFPSDGGRWLQNVMQKYPNFAGVLHELDAPSAFEANVAHLTETNAWWRDTQQVLFETDTYWKFWDGLDVNEQRGYNDRLAARAPWLKGYMSGSSTHLQSGGGGDGSFRFDGELSASQIKVVESPDFRNWPVTTKLDKVRLADAVYPEFSARNRWPDVPFGDDGSLQFSLGLCLKIQGQWYCDAPIELWRGLPGSGGSIQAQHVDGTTPGQIPRNWFYNSRWGPMAGYQPAPGEQIGVFVVAGDARNNNSPVKERSNIVLLRLPAEGASATFTAAGSTTTPSGRNGAAFVSQQKPAAKMSRGQKATVSVTLKNTGTTDWTAAKGYKLGSQSPTDNATWRLGRVPLAANETVKPGAQHRFSFQITAPAKAGSYKFQWRLAQDKVEWFGQLTPVVDVVVK